MTAVALAGSAAIGNAMAAGPQRDRPADAIFSADGGSVIVGWEDGELTSRALGGSASRPFARVPGDTEALARRGTRQIAVLSSDALRLLDFPSGRIDLQIPLGSGIAAYLQLSPDGTRALVYYLDERVGLVDLEKGRLLGWLKGDRRSGPAFVGKDIITYGGGIIRVWRSDASLRYTLDFNARSGKVFDGAAAIAGGTRLLIATFSGPAFEFDLASGALADMAPVELHEPTTLPVAGDRFLARFIDRWSLWDTGTGRRVGPVNHPSDSIKALLPAYDGHAVLFLRSGRLDVVNQQTAAVAASTSIPAISDVYETSPDGLHLLIKPKADIVYAIDLKVLDAPPTCMTLHAEVERCRAAAAIVGFASVATDPPLKLARDLIAALQAGDGDILADNEYHYLAAADRLLAADAIDDARAAYEWFLPRSEGDTRFQARLGLARALNAQHRPADAANLLNAVTAKGIPSLVFQCPNCEVKTELTRSYLAMKLSDEAVAASSAAVEESHALTLGPPGDSDGLRSATYLMMQAEALSAAHQPDRAAAARARAVQLVGDSQTELALRILSETKLAQAEAAASGAPSQADALAAEADETAARALDAANPLMLEVRERFGRLRIGLGQPAAALTPLRAAADAIVMTKAESAAQLTGRFRDVFRLQVAADWAVANGVAPGAAQVKTETNIAPKPAAAAPPVVTTPLTTAHREAVSAAIFSPDGSKVITGSADATVRVWDIHTGLQLRSFGFDSGVYGLGFTGPSRLIVFSGGGVSRIDLDTGTAAKLQRDSADKFAFSRVGAVAAFTRTVEVLDDQGAPRAALDSAGAQALGMSPDGKMVVVRNFDGVALFDAAAGRKIAMIADDDDFPDAIAMADRMAVVSGKWHRPGQTGLEEGLRSFDTLTGERLPNIASTNATGCLPVLMKISDHYLLSWGIALCVADLDGGGLRKLADVPDLIFDVAISNDGRMLAWPDAHGNIMLMNIAAHATKLLKGLSRTIRSLAFSPDGHMLVSASDDATARLWQVDSGKLIANLGH